MIRRLLTLFRLSRHFDPISPLETVSPMATGYMSSRNRDSVPYFFIDGLPVDITSEQIKALLAPYGTAITVAIALRPYSDFLAFAFVVMRTESEAEMARTALNGAYMSPHTMLRLASSLSPPFGWVKYDGARLDRNAPPAQGSS